MEYGFSARLEGVTVNERPSSSPSRVVENGTEAGSDFHPAGRSSRTVPRAGPLTLLWTTVLTENALASSGTMPKRGWIDIPIAGAAVSGSRTVPRPLTRFTVCTNCPTRIGAPLKLHSAHAASGYGASGLFRYWGSAMS